MIRSGSYQKTGAYVIRSLCDHKPQTGDDGDGELFAANLDAVD